MRILVVDDSEDFRDLLNGALLSAGYADVVTASSGWEALKLLDVGSSSDEKPAVDVALLDIVMPEMDGVEVCARIRNDRRYADLPIIMVTALDDMTHLSKAFVAGATDYLTKPINRIELIARVRAALRLKQELDRRQAREQELLGFLSKSGDRRSALWIDETTGLIAGEVAEAYLGAGCGCGPEDFISVLAITIDGFEEFRAADGEGAARHVLAEAARAIRRVTVPLGTVAASYRSDMTIVIAPDVDSDAARRLGEALLAAIAKVQLCDSVSVGSDCITASVVAITGLAKHPVDRMRLLTEAISNVKAAANAGGDRVVVLTL